MRALVIAIAFVAVGCPATRGVHPDAQFPDGGRGNDAGHAIDAGADGGHATDSGTDAAHAIDAGHDTGYANDAGHDAASSGGTLDPGLDVPPSTNEVCTTPGSLSECAGIAVCRFYDASEGRCESCTSCGNLGASCSASDECDILFTCYQGQCTNICPLGTSYCGPVADCLDVGHPTYGVCRP